MIRCIYKIVDNLFSCLMLLGCGFVCEEPRSDFTRQSKGCDYMRVLVLSQYRSTNREQQKVMLI